MRLTTSARRATPASPATLAALSIAACVALGLAAQAAEPAATLAQMGARYPSMSDVHIRKCDKDGDGLYTNAEQACVRSIYLATRNR